MLIKDLPKDIRIIAKIRTKQSGNQYEDDLELQDAFIWLHTKEGQKAWSDVNNGDFEKFRERRKQLKQQKQCKQ